MRLRVEHGRITAAENEHGIVELVDDDRGRLLAETFDGDTVTYERNAVGTLTALVKPGGGRIAYERDRDGRLIAVRDGASAQAARSRGGRRDRHATFGTGTASWWKSPWTMPGRLASWTLIAPGSRRRDADIARFSYDICDRLVGVSRGQARRAVHYDRAGRVTTVESSDPAFDERFEARRRKQPGARRRGRGRVRGVQPGDPGAGPSASPTTRWETSRNSLGLEPPPRRARPPDRGVSAGTVVRYAYDALGRRIRKEVGDRVTQYRWAGAQLLSETTIDGRGTVDRREYLLRPSRHPPRHATW